ncbi:MAG: molybdenum cofactor biosynthesis protein [Planctomycetota bacterium]|nr:MAG: molybdenum cofactor biosynthesis protein [Planctomycetota bacterium]
MENSHTPHAHGHEQKSFQTLGIVILAVSDTRNLKTDASGALLEEKLKTGGHRVLERRIVRDEVPLIQEAVKSWAQNPEVHVILVTGGTGMTPRDVTPEALQALFDKDIPGFGELFRMLSFKEIGTATIQSRACAGLMGSKLVFALPGSKGACRLAVEEILLPQLDARTKPCSLISLLEPQA